MPHFFISYAKKDTRELALQLNDALNALPNVTAWVDKSLKAGRSWELQIQTEIDRCDHMIVLYSPDINRHKNGQEESYMLSEIHYAKRIARKQIIPVMAQATEPPMSLITEQYIDFSLPPLSLHDLITSICNEAGIQKPYIPPPDALDALPLNPLPILPSAPTSSFAQIPFSSPASDQVEETRQKIVMRTSEPTTLSAADILPAPFSWLDIPDKDYSIAKYPITNAQFAKFIEAGGYDQKKWWTDAGWTHRDKDNWTEPRYWKDVKWNNAEHPVVGVSWYEAVAFCLWLSNVSGEKIMLPTEDQWQYAAEGDNGRDYPWGNQWDASRCNNNVRGKGIGKTTPVRHYEGKGHSLFGVVDMAGNVWEWCLTGYDNNTGDVNSIDNIRFLHGGSLLNDNIALFRCDSRIMLRPNDWNINNGFRISRS